MFTYNINKIFVNQLLKFVKKIYSILFSYLIGVVIKFLFMDEVKNINDANMANS